MGNKAPQESQQKNANAYLQRAEGLLANPDLLREECVYQFERAGLDAHGEMRRVELRRLLFTFARSLGSRKLTWEAIEAAAVVGTVEPEVAVVNQDEFFRCVFKTVHLVISELRCTLPEALDPERAPPQPSQDFSQEELLRWKRHQENLQHQQMLMQQKMRQQQPTPDQQQYWQQHQLQQQVQQQQVQHGMQHHQAQMQQLPSPDQQLQDQLHQQCHLHDMQAQNQLLHQAQLHEQQCQVHQQNQEEHQRPMEPQLLQQTSPVAQVPSLQHGAEAGHQHQLEPSGGYAPSFVEATAGAAPRPADGSAPEAEQPQDVDELSALKNSLASLDHLLQQRLHAGADDDPPDLSQGDHAQVQASAAAGREEADQRGAAPVDVKVSSEAASLPSLAEADGLCDRSAEGFGRNSSSASDGRQQDFGKLELHGSLAALDALLMRLDGKEPPSEVLACTAAAPADEHVHMPCPAMVELPVSPDVVDGSHLQDSAAAATGFPAVGHYAVAPAVVARVEHGAAEDGSDDSEKEDLPGRRKAAPKSLFAPAGGVAESVAGVDGMMAMVLSNEGSFDAQRLYVGRGLLVLTSPEQAASEPSYAQRFLCADDRSALDLGLLENALSGRDAASSPAVQLLPGFAVRGKETLDRILLLIFAGGEVLCLWLPRAEDCEWCLKAIRKEALAAGSRLES
eukprot:TRINITY_DN24894_c0_g1_i2.p1 TRINITY_DN24894_c0_g1~~TRINITY_DN24894_c0_g1_i2.p1  ORF type:complete len:680 (+),score=184.00 TRINITY_DN24894_c0_g1_i2:161-2200(+)